MTKEPCFALRKGKICVLRAEGVCIGAARCGFYKSAARLAADRQKSSDRVHRLPYALRQRISQKYYGGKMDWEGFANER